MEIDKRFYMSSIENMYNYISDLKRLYDNKKLIILGSDWNNSKKSTIIESIILRIPINTIYVFENINSKLICIDGNRRLEAIFNYMNNNYALDNLYIMNKLNNKKYSQLKGDNEKYLCRINDCQLHIMKIRYDVDKDFILEIYHRYHNMSKDNDYYINNIINKYKDEKPMF